MVTALGEVDDDARLAALRRYTVLEDEDDGSFERVSRLVRATLHVPMAAVSLVGFDQQRFKAPIGLPTDEIPRAISFCGAAIRTTEPLTIFDTHTDPRFQRHPLVAGPPHVRSYIGAPLTTPDGFNIGAVCGFDVVPRSFDPSEVEIMSELARLVVGELELRQAASVDQLTGALMRHAFLKRVDRIVEAADRPQAALAILDIDHFKQINDQHGHRSGDDVLRGFARHVLALKRPDDLFGRIGGEEFGLLMPGASTMEALERVEKLRRIVETMGIDAPVPVEVTVSIGLAPLLREIGTTGAWLHAADKALYEAKVFGRNRVVLGDGESAVVTEPSSPSGDRRRVRDLPVESEILSPLEVMRWVNKVH